MKTLSNIELGMIGGGTLTTVQEFIPEPILGHELIGWQQVLKGYDTTTWIEKGWFFNAYHEEKTPIYEFTPIYAAK